MAIKYKPRKATPPASEIIDEFYSIVENLQSRLAGNSGFATSSEFAAARRRLQALVKSAEGCTCGGRGYQVDKMLEAMKNGMRNPASTYGPQIFRKIWNSAMSSRTRIL